MEQEIDVETLKRWLERDQAIIKELRKENSRLKHEAEHFKAERNKMNSRYDRMIVTLERNAPDLLCGEANG